MSAGYDSILIFSFIIKIRKSGRPSHELFVSDLKDLNVSLRFQKRTGNKYNVSRNVVALAMINRSTLHYISLFVNFLN